jgi:hypothetical protein
VGTGAADDGPRSATDDVLEIGGGERGRWRDDAFGVGGVDTVEAEQDMEVDRSAGLIFGGFAVREADRGQQPVSAVAQEAKAWARIGDRRQTEVALDKGRRLLESLPYPENIDHHFVVDPTKFDFYAMDCYRIVGDNKIAETLANEVIQAYTDFDGQERSPMRLAEARITLGVVRAQEGDLDAAIEHGVRALQGKRKSLPTLLMASRDLTKILSDRYSAESKTRNYLDQVNALTALIHRQH